jgi:hypothetical protein
MNVCLLGGLHGPVEDTAVLTGSLRVSGPATRQWVSLARTLASQLEHRLTGIYQALGTEKFEPLESCFSQMEDLSLPPPRPAALIFNHSVFGPASATAISLAARGPFWTVEADELSAVTALVQAADDLEHGRCERALVLGAPSSQAPWLMLLGKEGSVPLRLQAIWTRPSLKEDALSTMERTLGSTLSLMTADPTDAHGAQALLRLLRGAEQGQAGALWCETPDGRGVLLGAAR